jgi:hypothetical protein
MPWQHIMSKAAYSTVLLHVFDQMLNLSSNACMLNIAA